MSLSDVYRPLRGLMYSDGLPALYPPAPLRPKSTPTQKLKHQLAWAEYEKEMSARRLARRNLELRRANTWLYCFATAAFLGWAAFGVTLALAATGAFQ